MSLIERLQQMAVDPYHGEITTADCEKILRLVDVAKRMLMALRSVDGYIDWPVNDDFDSTMAKRPPPLKKWRNRERRHAETDRHHPDGRCPAGLCPHGTSPHAGRRTAEQGLRDRAGLREQDIALSRQSS